MRGNMHREIVRAAVGMLPDKLQEFLNSPVESPTAWHPNKLLLEYVLEGAVSEDSETSAGPLPDPDPQNVPTWFFEGDHWPHLEHFWNTDLDEHSGLDFQVAGVTLGSFRSLLDRACDYWGMHVLDNYQNGRFEQAMDSLGRVLHLLVDAGTPAHVHGDPHVGLLKDTFVGGYDDDDYETYTFDRVPEVGDPLPYEWACHDTAVVYNPVWDFKTFFYELAEISRLYDSDDCDGLGEGQPYHWDHCWESLEGLLSITRDITGDLTDSACEAIARDLVPTTVRFVAGMLIYFFKTIEQYLHFEVQLYGLEVSVLGFHVYDDTDPMGSGEIFLTVQLPPLQAVQVGGEWDLASGGSTGISGVNFSRSVASLDEPVAFVAHAYDDDSNWFSDSSESLGDIVYQIDLRSLGADPVVIRVDSGGGSGRFGLDLQIKLWPSSVPSFSSIMSYFRANLLTDTVVLKKTRYSMADFPPLLVNIDTLALHGLAEGGRRHCRKWENLAAEKKLEIHMFESELFKLRAGRTQLEEIVEKLRGVGSKQARSVADERAFKGHCSCLRVGWATDIDGR